VALRVGRLSHGNRPRRQNGHSQRCRQEWGRPGRAGALACQRPDWLLTRPAQNLKLTPVEIPSSWQPPQVVGPALL
jgi:hypothetical protein